MKKNPKIKFDTAWWRKECPKELFRVKEYTRFVDAIGDYESAERALDLDAGGDDQLTTAQINELNKAKAALKSIEKPRKEFMEYCEDRADSEKDKKLKEQFAILAEVMKRTMPGAMAEQAKILDSYDGDAVDAPMVTPDSHGKYLAKTLPRLKRLPYNFGFALVDNEPTSNRFFFHKQKAPRSLANSLKNDVRPRVLTFGVAYGGGIYPGGDYPAATLVLVVQGKMVPSFARRVRLMLKEFGQSLFNNVVVVKDGIVMEKSTEEEGDDLNLEEVAQEDLSDISDAPEPAADAPVKSGISKEDYAAMQEQDRQSDLPPPPPPPPGAAAAPPPPPPPEPAKAEAPPKSAGAPLEEQIAWERLRRQIAKKVETAIATKWGPYKKVQGMWRAALQGVEQGKYAPAMKAGTAIQKMLEGYTMEPEEPHQEYRRKKKKLSPVMWDLLRQRKGDVAGMASAMGMAELLAEDGKYQEALRYLDLVARYIADSEKPPKEKIPKDPSARRDMAQDLLAKLAAMEGDLEQAVAALKSAEKPSDRSGDVATNREAVYKALHSPGGRFPSGFVESTEKGGDRLDLKKAQLAISRLQEVIYAARRVARLKSKTLDEVKKAAKALDKEVRGIAHLVREPSLREHFKLASQTRDKVLRELRRSDIYAAEAKLEPWKKAVSALMTEANAFEAASQPA